MHQPEALEGNLSLPLSLCVDFSVQVLGWEPLMSPLGCPQIPPEWSLLLRTVRPDVWGLWYGI